MKSKVPFNHLVRDSHAKTELTVVEFALCAKEHYISVGYTCRDHKKAMNTCLRKHGTVDERDRARDEWFENKRREQLKRQEEELERKRLELQKLQGPPKSNGSWFGWFWNLTAKPESGV
jgi:Cytochrome c oxidase biogenesis protein Cmc1 like